LPRNGKALRRLRCRYEGHAFSIHCCSFRELAPFVEVFVAGDYEGDWKQCRTILDVGANIGAASLFFSIRSPEARIFAVEPDTGNVMRLRPNLAQIPGALHVPKAIAGTTGPLAFYRTEGFNLGASLMEKRAGFVEVAVEAIAFDELLAELHLESVDLCKFDIEGAEFEAFSGLADTSRIRQFVGEYHEDLARKPVAEFLRLFPKHTTEAVEIAPQRYVCRGVLKQVPIVIPARLPDSEAAAAA
jgi:FkbM family methyltransferase